MSSNIKAACLLLALAASSQTAYAVTCYQIVDRDNSPIYSATEPPFPMAGQPWEDGQQRLRATGRHLLWFDTPACPYVSLQSISVIMGYPVAATGATTGGRAARRDRG